MNNRVDFYILDGSIDRQQFACHLIEKAFKQKHRLFIQCLDEAAAHAFDDILWVFKETSFIPHNLQGEGPTPPPPVQIGYSAQAQGFNDILINLTLSVPEFHKQFKRIIEIVDETETVKQALRANYRFYQSQGYPLHSHTIDKLPSA